MNHLQTIRDRVIAAVPSILDLKFGCEVKTRTGMMAGVIISVDDSYYDCIRNGKVRSTRKDFIIPIGRPIRLADVLVAINRFAPRTYRIDSGGYFDSSSADDFWNLLTDDLNLQSPETIEFLYNLLK